MTCRLIEDCFDQELCEEMWYNNYITLSINRGSFVIVDPFVINIQDLLNTKRGGITLVRVRRPFWGRGNVKEFITVLEVK